MVSRTGKRVLSNRTEETSQRQETPENAYVGSVLFFKHVILGVVIVCIAVPTVLAVWFGVQLHGLRAQTAELQDQVTQTAAGTAGDSDSGGASDSGEAAAGDSQPEVPAYTQLYPDLYADPVDYGSVDVESSVYLTFDDGPSERTDEILNILDRYGIHATFFVIGQSGEENLQRMRNIVAAGHTLGIHSYSHDYQKIYASVEAYLEDFYQMYCQIVETTGVKPQVFRFPGGSINSYNGKVYKEIIAEMTRRGFVYFDWNVSNGDAASSKLQSAQTLAENALKGAGSTRRSIILMHDSGVKTTTVEALPSIIEGYQKAGYTFAALTAETKPVAFGYLQ